MSGERYEYQIVEVKCPICGKVFFPSPGHVYKDKYNSSKRVCSWSCVRKSERLKEEAKAEREDKRKRVKPSES